MKNIGIFLNPYYKEYEPIFKLLEKLYQNSKIKFYLIKNENNIDKDFLKNISSKDYPQLDCILVFGGDGTILRAKDYVLKARVPLLGINLGKLGFLSESSLAELEKSVHDLINNRFQIQERMLLDVRLERDNNMIYTGLALNDAVVYKGKIPKLLELTLFCNDNFVVETRCDGMIISTPTGSTAYSLSAGGPILSPIMEAIIAAPLNPHVLTVRPMVFSSVDELCIKIEYKTILQLDGKNVYNLIKGDRVLITASEEKIKFINLTSKTFYKILRKKLHMGKK